MVREGYKQTELGEIPEDWDLHPLAEAAEFINGRAYAIHEWETQGTPVIRLQNLTGRGDDFYYSNLNLPDKQYCHFNDLLFMWSATFGPVIWRGEKAIFHYHIWKVEMKDNYSRIYLYYMLGKMTDGLKKRSSSGGTMLHVTKAKMESTIICFPHAKEQQAIAKALSDVDGLIDGLTKLITKKQDIKTGTMQQLLTGKTRLPGFGEGKGYKQTELGVIPEDWEVLSLGQVAYVVGGGTPSTNVHDFWNGGINWFTPTEIGEHKYVNNSVRSLSEQGVQNSSAKMLPKGAILLTTRASIGDLAILKKEGATNQGFQNLILKGNNINEYLYYMLKSKKKDLLKNASGSTFLEISPNKVKSLLLKYPSTIAEQAAITQILSNMDKELDYLQTRLDKTKSIKQGMMQELLTGKNRLI